MTGNNDLNERIKCFLNEVPLDVALVAATKSRSIQEIKQAIKSGIKIIGENYIQEAKEKYFKLKGQVSFHLIGHLQTNKVKDAVEIFDMIQTVDSVKIAKEIGKRTKKIMPVLIEVNIGLEKNKSGIFPEKVIDLAKEISNLKNIKVKGLMAMCPVLINPEDYRQYFRKMRQLFSEIKNKDIPNVSMEILSMGMSDNYDIAIEEGSNMVRIGRVLFG